MVQQVIDSAADSDVDKRNVERTSGFRCQEWIQDSPRGSGRSDPDLVRIRHDLGVGFVPLGPIPLRPSSTWARFHTSQFDQGEFHLPKASSANFSTLVKNITLRPTHVLIQGHMFSTRANGGTLFSRNLPHQTQCEPGPPFPLDRPKFGSFFPWL